MSKFGWDMSDPLGKFCLAVGGLLAAPMLSVAAPLVLDKASIGVEGYYYPQQGFPGQGQGTHAFIFEAETHAKIDSKNFFVLTPFARYDPEHTNRSSFDLREAGFKHIDGPWQFYAGMGKVSWSTTEAPNIIPFQTVDVINQRDLRADPTGQEKLGAPMISLAHQGRSVGTQFYLLPLFRPRIFPEPYERENPSAGTVNLNDNNIYTDSQGQKSLGAALRVEAVTENVNAAFIQYHGYAPQPLIFPDYATRSSTNLYYQVNMSGVTVQATYGSLLLKGETAYYNTGVSKSYSDQIPGNYVTSNLGAEYTLVHFSGDSDLGLLVEWLKDTRGDGPNGNVFSNAVFMGGRWVANNDNDAQITGGVLQTLNHNDTVMQIQYETRLLGKFWLVLGARGYSIRSNTALKAFNSDDVIYSRLKYFF